MEEHREASIDIAQELLPKMLDLSMEEIPFFFLGLLSTLTAWAMEHDRQFEKLEKEVKLLRPERGTGEEVR